MSILRSLPVEGRQTPGGVICLHPMRNRSRFLLGAALAALGCSSPTASTPGVDAATGTDAVATEAAAADVVATDTPRPDVVPTDGGGGPMPARITQCPGTIPAAPSGVCAVTAGGANLLLRGTVLAPGEVFRGGSVAVDAAGRITCVGCDCAAMAAGATEINCANGVISPGLINAHDHITFNQNAPYTVRSDERYEHRHDWRRGQNGHTSIPAPGNASNDQQAWHELRMVMSGTTSINGSGGVAGFLRNLDRSSAQMEGLGQRTVSYQTFPLGDSGGQRLMMGCGYPNIDPTSDATGTDAYAPHVAEGIDSTARNEFLCIRSGMNDLVQRQSAFVHGIALLPIDIAEMATDGTKLIWSPRSNITLYGETARVTEYARLGVTISLGTDWMPSGSMNMLRELRCADDLNRNFMGGFFSDEQLWLMATRNAAQALAVEDATGAIAVGLVADLAVYNGATNRDHRAVLSAGAQDVSLVLRGGTVLFGDAEAVNGLPGGAMCDTLDVCGTMKRVCVSSQLGGRNLASLQMANNGRYPLFFCGEPMNEPSCLPARTRTMNPMASVNGSTVYAGMSTMGDMDGDGIANASDNCPTVFNPVRPLDNMRQADADMDGQGDSCDVCPLNANTTMCAIPERDADMDGVPDARDNCPAVANMNQADADMDMRGDACDPCPMVANPGSMMCPAVVRTIPQVRNPMDPMRPAADALVTVQGGVVTAVKSAGTTFGLVVQDPTATRWGGIYIFLNATRPTVAVGDAVNITGTFTTFRGLEQLTLGTTGSVMRTGAGMVPAPIVVTPAEVRTGGARTMELQSMLVRVEGVVATAPTMGTDFRVGTSAMDTNSLIVTTFVANDTAAGPVTATMGQMFTSITGVMYSFGPGAGPFDSKLAIRNAMDVVAP